MKNENEPLSPLKEIERFNIIFKDIRFRLTEGFDNETLREAYIDLDRVAQLREIKDTDKPGYYLFLNPSTSHPKYDWTSHIASGKLRNIGAWHCIPCKEIDKKTLDEIVEKAYPETNSNRIIRWIEKNRELTQSNHHAFDFKKLIDSMPPKKTPESENLIPEIIASSDSKTKESDRTKIAIEGLREIYKEAHGEMRARRTTEFEIVRSHLAACGFVTAVTNAWAVAVKPSWGALLAVFTILSATLSILWWNVHKRIAYDNNSYRYFSAIKSGIEKFWLGKPLSEMQPKLDIGPRGDGYRRTQTLVFQLTAGLMLLNTALFGLGSCSHSTAPARNHEDSSLSAHQGNPSPKPSPEELKTENPEDNQHGNSEPSSIGTPNDPAIEIREAADVMPNF